MKKSVNKKHIVIIAIGILISAIAISTWIQFNKTSYTNTLAKEESYAPDFKLKKGEYYYSRLKENNENILLFWSSSCPHCEEAIEYIKTDKIYKKVKDKIFTISTDENITDVKKYAQDFPIYLDYNYKIF